MIVNRKQENMTTEHAARNNMAYLTLEYLTQQSQES
jgi:hypothetical protein